MMQQLVEQLAHQAQHTIATALIDLDTFENLAVWCKSTTFTEAHANMFTLAAAELFRGPKVIKAEELLAAERNQTFQYHIDEFYFHTLATHHFMMIVPNTAILAVLITSASNHRETDREILFQFLPSIIPHCPAPAVVADHVF